MNESGINLESWLEVSKLTAPVGGSVLRTKCCWLKKAAIAEMEEILDAGGFEIRTFASWGGTENAPLIRINVVVDKEKLRSYGGHVGELEVIIFPAAEGFDQALFDRAAQKYAKKKEEDQKRSEQVVGAAIHKSALTIYRECARLQLALKGLPLSEPLAMDREILESVAALGDAVVELKSPIAEAVEHIVNGHGSELSAFFDLLEVPDPSAQELKRGLRTALKSVLACHFLKFTKEDLEENFVAVFLSFLGTWGGHGFESGYLARSAAIIRLLRAHKPEIPDVAGLVENFHQTDWVERFIYQINKPDSSVVFYQDIRDSQKERLEKISGGEVSRLDDDFIKKVLVPALALKYVVETEVEGKIPEALVQELADACINPRAPFMPHNPADHPSDMPIYSLALAALCNVAGILPQRAVVELRKEGAGRQIIRRYLGLTGGRAVVLTSPLDAKRSPAAFLLYLFGHKDTEGFLKKPAKPSKAISGNGELECRFIQGGDFLSKRIYEGMIVLWIMDEASFEAFFAEEAELARKLLERVLKGETK